ncbi:hypothetical protein X769_17715 [Mesorhizobium sp. LSJC268A00]|nr:hypothetical protein X769_17715 [Mesorhizobium sp. LSJC268A00]
MPRFSEYFQLNKSQSELDFVDVSNDYDTPVYVDPYAIEIRDDIWAARASESIRSFFLEVMAALKAKDRFRATNLMSHLHEPRETFLGVSSGTPQGLGVGAGQAGQLINAILGSAAYKSGLLTDLSEVALYVPGIDRDKISDLTTNIIRHLLQEYTEEQCDLFGIPVKPFSGPPGWDVNKKNWVSRYANLPDIDGEPVILIPKYIVRRNLSLNSQEFYNKQITDFLVAENLKANSSLVQTIKGVSVVYKKDVREANPPSKNFTAEIVLANPELLKLYKELAKRHSSLAVFNDEDPSVTAICGRLVPLFNQIPTGAKAASDYHNLITGALTALFYPDLIQPHKEWEIHDGRKRIDIVFTNAADDGFFAQRRDDRATRANTVVVECKNYTSDIHNQEIDQLLGRFDKNRGYFGIITCRNIEDKVTLEKRLRDAATRHQGYIVALTDKDIIEMLDWKASLNDDAIRAKLFGMYRALLA